MHAPCPIHRSFRILTDLLMRLDHQLSSEGTSHQNSTTRTPVCRFAHQRGNTSHLFHTCFCRNPHTSSCSFLGNQSLPSDALECARHLCPLCCFLLCHEITNNNYFIKALLLFLYFGFMNSFTLQMDKRGPKINRGHSWFFSRSSHFCIQCKRYWTPLAVLWYNRYCNFWFFKTQYPAFQLKVLWNYQAISHLLYVADIALVKLCEGWLTTLYRLSAPSISPLHRPSPSLQGPNWLLGRWLFLWWDIVWHR